MYLTNVVYKIVNICLGLNDGIGTVNYANKFI